jgi:hypothetical protein
MTPLKTTKLLTQRHRMITMNPERIRISLISKLYIRAIKRKKDCSHWNKRKKQGYLPKRKPLNSKLNNGENLMPELLMKLIRVKK